MNEFWLIVISVGVLFASMSLHELAHGLMAYWLGDDTAKEEGRLTVNPLAHTDLGMSLLLPVMMIVLGLPVIGAAKPVPVRYDKLKGKEYGMALVALAGPLMNFIIALILTIIGHHVGILYWGNLWSAAITGAIFMNLSLMIFNLIPIPPLDGSRVLYLIAPDSIRGMMRKAEGSMLWMLVFLFVVMGNWITPIMRWGMNSVWGFIVWLVA